MTTPRSPLDLFSDDTLADPYPHYAALRAQGPAIHLPAHDIWALSRYADVRTALLDARTFSSVDGVALTTAANRTILAGTVLASDGPDHARLRRILSRQLARPNVDTLITEVHQRADRLVRHLVEQGTFDADQDLAQVLVADVVLDLMGLSPTTRDALIHDAAATFELFGPANARYTAAEPAAAAMFAFLNDVVTPNTVRPNSWMAALYDAADAGEITHEEVVPLMSAYTTAGMDTTIHGISTALQLLAADPQQFAALRNNRVTADQVFHEALRFDAPISGFGRRVMRDVTVDGTAIPAGAQVWLLYGSTGRDERRWGESADAFDVHRPEAERHLALGAGTHVCAGNHLAVLQARAVLTAVARRCKRIRPAGTPERAVHNILRGWHGLPIEVVPDRRHRIR
jgi:cytochrome P450